LVLLQMRNAAVDLTRRYAADSVVRGFRFRPTEFGTMADAILKAHVLEGIDQGVLPSTLGVVKRRRFHLPEGSLER
jgi:hypothetical protein